ncbi:MAG TPA: hypothetical protein VGD80_19180 [Kofleriaceae bacterium]
MMLNAPIDEWRRPMASFDPADHDGHNPMAPSQAHCFEDVEDISIPAFHDAVAESFQSPDMRYVPGAAGSDAYREQELRAYCCRLFGWGDDVADVVDDTMHILLTAARQGTPIALRGASDPVPVAHALHHRLFGVDAPFVVCDPRRRQGEGSVRSPPNRATGALAVEAAVGGSVCVHAACPPPDFETLAGSFRRDGALAMLFVCLHDKNSIRDALCPPIEIPSLGDRAPDLERLLDEYLEEAATVLAVRRVRLAAHVRESVLRHVASLSDLEHTAFRLVAIASSPSLAQAATRLHMAPVSLSRWVSRRRWITGFLCERGNDTNVQ